MKTLSSLRAVLVTGKGGVGKTTVAASLARSFAAQGRRVLVAEMVGESTLASPLAEALGVGRLSDDPLDVAPNLRAMLLTPTPGHHKFLRDVLPMHLLADAAMRSAAIRRFLAAAPTFPEMGVLYRLLDLVRMRRPDGSFEHETIVVDLPATGHALALAQIPSSLLRVLPTGPIAAAVREGLELLKDPAKTGAVIVTLPETLPVSEALELLAGIRSHDIPVSQVVLNRVPNDPFSDEERDLVRDLLAKVPPLLGARTLERIDRARHSLARLAREVTVPILSFPELRHEGPGLAEAVASRLDPQGVP